MKYPSKSAAERFWAKVDHRGPDRDTAPAPLREQVRAAIRARHALVDGFCPACGPLTHPCDVSLLLDALDEALAWKAAAFQRLQAELDRQIAAAPSPQPEPTGLVERVAEAMHPAWDRAVLGFPRKQEEQAKRTALAVVRANLPERWDLEEANGPERTAALGYNLALEQTRARLS